MGSFYPLMPGSCFGTAMRTDTTFRFSARLAGADPWQDLGSILTTPKDGLTRINMIAKTWSAHPVEITFSDFSILPGGWR